MQDLPDPGGAGAAPQDGSSFREVAYEFSKNFPAILERIGASLLVSTYQAGKLVVLGVSGGRLVLSFHSFDRAMGVAVGADRIAVGARTVIWFLRAAPQIARSVAPAGQHDACFLARAAHVTGEIQVHEMAWSGPELWAVNTLFSCLCTLDEAHSFVPRWLPPFVSGLAAEDRCHLNGLAMEAGRPKYVTALGETGSTQGWRPGKATGGCLIDVPSGETVARGFAMPHSPRIHRGRTWLLDSGMGRLVSVETDTGRVEPVADVPGYARGLDFAGPFAFVGLSKIRETSTFGGVPIAERRDQLRCGVAVVDVESGRTIARFEFRSGVEEVFDVRVVPGALCPAIAGPSPTDEGAEPIWLAPHPRPVAVPRP
jgi:uncharacterized protein (TIGR03032 family)